MAALQKFLASFRTWDPVAWSSTRHVALGVWAARRTLLFSAGSAWFAAPFCASRMAALDVAPLVAKRAWFFAVTWSRACMPAISIVTSTWLTAFAMVFLRDIRALTRPTLATFVLASMAAGLQRAAGCTADIER